jgi:ubiquinone biosynthesis protein UbiJ
MLTVLLLAGAEKLINFAITSDEITKAGLAPLAGKVLRLNMVRLTLTWISYLLMSVCVLSL